MRRATAIVVFTIAGCAAAVAYWNLAALEGEKPLESGPAPAPGATAPRPDAAAPTSPRVRVQVVDADTGAPIAGAAVTGFRVKPPAERPVAAASRVDAEMALEATDERGETGFASAGSGVVLEATTSSGLYGRATFQDLAPEPLVLRMRRDCAVHVMVESRAGGTPVGGVPVCLGEARDDQGSAGFRRRMACRTGPSGIATFRHVQEWLPATAGTHTATIDIPLLEPVLAAIPAQNTEDEPVVLQLPATGVLVVRVVGERSEQPIADLRVGVTAYADAATRRPAAKPRLWATTAADGEARFEPIGTGLWFCASLADAPDGGALGRLGEGPLANGEVRRIDLRLPEGRRAVHGSVVTAEGEPWRRAMLRVDAFAGERRLTRDFGLHCTTDGEGQFDLSLLAGNAEGIELTIAAITTEEHPEPMAWLRLGKAGDAGPTDVGAVVLDQGPLLASGRVLWARDHAPIPADVTVTAVDGSGAAVATRLLAGGGLSFGSDHFCVRVAGGVEPPGGLVRIAVQGKGLIDTMVEGPVGRSDWIVPVHKLGAVKGRVQLAGDVAPGECSLGLVRGSIGCGSAELDANGGFAFTNVKPGTYEVVATLDSERHAGTYRAIASVPDVVVAEDLTTEDARLDGMRLGSVLPLFEVRVADEQGGAVRGAAVRIDEKEAERSLPTTDVAGCLRLRLRAPTRILVTCSGFLPWIGDVAPGVTPVVLARAR
ncbi:MAG: hypothetical protein U1E73_07180 [Planctomycetota bacterium]